MRQHMCMHDATVDKAYFSGAEGFKGITKFNMHFTLDNESKLNIIMAMFLHYIMVREQKVYTEGMRIID